MGEDSPKLPRQLQGFSAVLGKPGLFQLVLVELVLELQGRRGYGGCGHPSLQTQLWLNATAGLPRQAVRMRLLTLVIGYQVTRERYSLCPGVRSFSILLPLCPGDRCNKTARATAKQMPEQQKRFVGETCMSYHSPGSASKRA